MRTRQALHGAHALTAVVLILTGWLIGYPDLRGRLLGGFGRELLDVHLWAGWAFLLAPLVALALARGALLGDLGRRSSGLGPGPAWTWPRLHLIASLAVSVLLGASGLVLWIGVDLEARWLDLALWFHEVCTWILAVSIPVHLVAARRRMVAVFRSWLGRDEDPEAFLHVDADGRPVEADDPPGAGGDV